jgi:hypothetical protein
LDLITRHRLGMLGLAGDAFDVEPLTTRVARAYRAFVDRVPFENLSNAMSCRDAPDTPESWPRTTDRFLREHRAKGLGGTSFTLAYALRDLFRGLGANAHCTLGHNLVTEEAHAAVIVYAEEGPLLFDPALLVAGAVPVRPEGAFEDALGCVTLRPRDGPTLTLCLRMCDDADERRVYSLVPMPAAPQSYRQAWIASFHRGRPGPLRIARRFGDEIRRYGERPGRLEVLRADGREERPLTDDVATALAEAFGIDAECLRSWFAREKPGEPAG